MGLLNYDTFSRGLSGAGQNEDLVRPHQLSVPHFNDIHAIETSRGELLTLGRLFRGQGDWRKESMGDYDIRVNLARAAIEGALKSRYNLKGVRVTNAEGPHMVADPSASPFPSDIPADFISGYWLPKNVDAYLLGPAVKPIIHVPTDLEVMMDVYEQLTQQSFLPFLSTQGFGVAQVAVISPRLLLGLRGYSDNGYSYDQLIEAILTKWGFFRECFPEVEQLSRQSISKQTAYGFSEDTKTYEWIISTPSQSTTEFAARVNSGYEHGDFWDHPKLRSRFAEHIEMVQKRYEAARRGRVNHESGQGLSRMVVLGEPPGNYNSRESLTLPEQRFMVQAFIRNWCEEFCGPPEYWKYRRISESKDPDITSSARREAREICRDIEETYDGPIRRPNTFSIMQQWNTKNYQNLPLTDFPPMPSWVIQVPWVEYSKKERLKVYPDSNGNEPELRGRRYLMPTFSDPWYNKRQDRNDPQSRGISGVSGGMAKYIELDIPYDKIDPWNYEDMVCRNYANFMDGDFNVEAYAYDSFQGPVQNAQWWNPANNRSQIIRTGKSKRVLEDPRQATQVAQAAINPYTGAALTPVQGERFQIFRDFRGLFPEVLRSSGWFQAVNLLYEDTIRASEIAWTDEDQTEGYAIIDILPGEDLELPGTDNNLYIACAFANFYDKNTEKFCANDEEIVIGPCDLQRSWPRAFDRLKVYYQGKDASNLSLEEVESVFADTEDAGIVETDQAITSFRFRFAIRVTKQKVKSDQDETVLVVEQDSVKDLKYDALVIDYSGKGLTDQQRLSVLEESYKKLIERIPSLNDAPQYIRDHTLGLVRAMIRSQGPTSPQTTVFLGHCDQIVQNIEAAIAAEIRNRKI